jgi:hypothetical protein
MGDAFLTRTGTNLKFSDINTMRNCNCQTSGNSFGDTVSINTMYSWYLTNAFLPNDDGSGVNPAKLSEFKCGQIMTGDIQAIPETPNSPYNLNNNGRIVTSLLPEGVVTDGSGDKCYQFSITGDGGTTVCGPQSSPSATFTGLNAATYSVTLKDNLTQSCIVQTGVKVNLGGKSNFFRQLQDNTC